MAQGWWVYILRCRSGALYTGITTDVARRFAQHSNGIRKGGARFFAMDPPEEVVYREHFPDRGSASARECQIKQLKRGAKRELVEGFAAAAMRSTQSLGDLGDNVEQIKLSSR